MKRVKKEAKKGKSADKKPNTQKIRREQYTTILNQMQMNSQCYRILKHLIRKGHITSREIERELDIISATARMSELRSPNKWALPISKKTVTTTDRFGHPTSYGVYTLEVK